MLVVLDTVWFHWRIYALKKINNLFVVTQQLVFHLFFLSNRQRQKKFKNLQNFKPKEKHQTQKSFFISNRINEAVTMKIKFDFSKLPKIWCSTTFYRFTLCSSTCSQVKVYYRSSELRYSDKSGLFILTVCRPVKRSKRVCLLLKANQQFLLFISVRYGMIGF